MDNFVLKNVDNYWSFAPFECCANCILSLLKIWDMDTTLFFLQYWFLNYDQLILSSKHPRLNYMEYYYNHDYHFYNSNHDSIIEYLNTGGSVMQYCDTKSLVYYPQDYTGGGDFGLMHFIIIYGYNDEKELFYILDPTVAFKGILSYSDVDKLIDEVDYKVFIGYKKNESSKPNENKIEVFKTASRQSYLLYHLAEKDCGIKATEKFIVDLEECETWTEEKRDNWLFYNCVSLTTIVKNRNAIKSSLDSFGLLSSEQLERCDNLFQSVLKNWNALNFLMTKFRMRKDFMLIGKITDKLITVQKAESRFLEKFYEIGKSL